ncbi:MAG: hypothetical protein AB7R89_21335 [Dehalococcoidia bacterium]
MIDKAGKGTEARRDATPGQIRAVYTAMRIIAEDDRERGAPLDTVACTACRRDRPAAGAVRYGAAHLCNGCATDFEVLRLAGIASDVDAYLRHLPLAATAG